MAKAIQKNEEEIQKIEEQKAEEIKNEVNDEIEEDKKEQNFTRIYIGPTILAYNLAENTIFIDSFPENINKAIEKYPTINNLMIDIDKLQDRNNEYYKNNYLILKNELGGK